MAETPAQQASIYPIAAYNFRVNVDGATLRFAKVSGLVREHQTQTYRDGLSFLDGERVVKYYLDKFVTVTLEQGVVSGDHKLVQWLESDEARLVEVQLCDAAGNVVLTWRIRKALAVKLSAPALDARTNELVIDSLELKAAGISVEVPK